MIIFISGLALFFAPHVYSAVRPRASERDVKARLGKGVYMGLYSLVSAAGLGLLVYGYWSSPALGALYVSLTETRLIVHGAMLVALVLIVAAYAPANHIRQRLRHPMVLAIAIWAGSHLTLSTDVKELLLFGSFLLYAVVDGISAFKRPYVQEDAARVHNDVLVIVLAGGIYGMLVLWLHPVLFGAPVL
ncbi:NnrU family protein [Marinicauda pacifica]|uniref:NnrU family protein n=1 Tax=Marinicauda pacifica TaxID=1133559 RepID=UPI0035C7DE4E